MLNEWQQNRLRERIEADNDLANASDTQVDKIRDLISDVGTTQSLSGTVDHILDVLDPNNNNDPLLKLAARMCLEVLCEVETSLVES